MRTFKESIKTTALKVVLQNDSKMIDEVVVTGYQNIRNRVYTGASTAVKMTEIKLEGVGDVSRMLEGRVPGLSIQNISGTFGAAPRINIRGGASIMGNVQPLWVIDGAVYEDLVHVSPEDLASGDAVTLISSAVAGLNPADIQDIQILKDASAAAIYGSRAANGVIIVTTKKGKKGPMKVNVSVKETIEWSPKYDLMNAENYKYYNDIAYEEAIKNEIGAVKTKQLHSDFDTDWQREVLKTALVQDYNVSLSGGGEGGSYYVSGGYLNNDGVSYGFIDADDIYFHKTVKAIKKALFHNGLMYSIRGRSLQDIQAGSKIGLI